MILFCMTLIRKITYLLAKLQDIAINDQLLMHYIFQAYSCNLVLVNREKAVPHRGNIANRGNMKRRITHLCITSFST